MILSLVRHAYLPTVTLGHLRVGPLVLATLEEPWRPDPDGPGGQKREGMIMESCVPDGSYILRPHNGAKWRNVWALENEALGVYHFPDDVPPYQKFGRSMVLIHSGNTADDTIGCILVGMSHSRMDGKDCVLESRKALNLLRGQITRGSHQLEIRATLGTKEAA